MTTPIARRCVRRAGNNGVTTNAWLVGGNSNLPTTDGDTYVLGITGDTNVGSDMAIVTGDDPRIHINGDAPLGAPFGAQSGGRVYVNNGAVETLSVPMTVQHVVESADADPTFVDLYMNLPSNAYTVTLGADDTSVNEVVNINNIFGAQLPPPAADRGTIGYPTTLAGIYSNAAITDALTFSEFTYTLRIINDSTTDPLDVTFTPNSGKLTTTAVSYSLAPYTIPAGGYMIATFRVIRGGVVDGGTPTSEQHMMIAHTVYDASGSNTP